MSLFRSVLPIVLSALVATISQAQQWVDLMMDDSTNIHTVKEAFDAYWEGRPYQKGKGWKQFQRWYWFQEQRTWPSGERLDPAVFLEAAEEVRTMRMEGSGDRDDAVWESLGPTSWTSTGYNPGNGRVNTVCVDPENPAIIYAGTPSGGLWRSNDGGGTWQALFNDLPSMGVSGIAIDTTGTGTIYIATGDGDGSDTYSAGVLKSVDGGATWLTTGLNWSINLERTTRALRMNPANPQELYCATSSGLYRTTDGADTWQQVLSGGIRDVEIIPGDSTVVLACSQVLFRSVDGGNFTSVPFSGLPGSGDVGRMAVAVAPTDPTMIYVLCGSDLDNGFLGLFRSTDGGFTFEERSDGPNIFGYAMDASDAGGQAWYDMALAIDPQDANTIYAGGINVWKSIDGGDTWHIKSHWVWPSDVGYTHADIHSLDFFGNTLYCGSDGGLHVTDDGAIEWQDISAGMDIMQFYRMGGSELLPQLIMAGAQDNGSNRYQNGAWTHVLGADGMEAAVDVEEPSTVYATTQNGGLNRSDNGGTDWVDIRPGLEGPWVTPFELDRTWTGRMIAGYYNLWASENRGDNWYQLTFWEEDQFVRCIGIAPSDGTVIYAARNNKVERANDGGFVWTDIRPGLPGGSPTSFAVDADDPMHVWISFSGTTPNNKVYESLNGGEDWINRSLNLPNVPVNSIVMQPGSPHGIYAGTDLGVFYIDDYATQWEPYGVGMPNVVVSELEINMASGKLRAATYGRGIWQADLYFSPFASVEEQSLGEGPRVLALDQSGTYLVQMTESTGRLDHVRVLDPLGRELIHERARAVNECVVNLESRAAGTYLIVVAAQNGAWCKRVIR
jgi:hypothetical protein